MNDTKLFQDEMISEILEDYFVVTDMLINTQKFGKAVEHSLLAMHFRKIANLVAIALPTPEKAERRVLH